MKIFRIVPLLFMLTYACHSQNGPSQPQVVISYTQSTTPGVTANCLYRSTTSTPVLPGVCTLTAVTAITDSSPVAGTTYNYWITAKVGTVESAYSLPLNVPVPANPNAPTGLAPLTVTKNEGEKPGDLVAKVEWKKRP